MRLRVLHQHVVVQMLASRAHKQPVDQALAAFAGQHRMHVVAHQPAAQQNRVRSDIRAARLLHAQRGNVERGKIFALDHEMRNHGVLRRPPVPSPRWRTRPRLRATHNLQSPRPGSAASATISVRGCVMVSAPAPADTYSTCTGCSNTAPRRMRTYAPSSQSAVFNAENTSRSTSA